MQNKLTDSSYSVADICHYISRAGKPHLAKCFLSMSTGKPYNKEQMEELKRFFIEKSPFSNLLSRINRITELSWTAIREIYKNEPSSNMDSMIFNTRTAKGLRERRKYVITLTIEEVRKRLETSRFPVHVLNIGSGNNEDCFHVLEALRVDGMNKAVFITCIDSFTPALREGKRIAEKTKNSDKVQFIKGNAFKINRYINDGLEKGDITLMIGLPDYFEGSLLSRLFDNFRASLSDDGTGITGNIRPHEMGGYMRMFNWTLLERERAEFGEILLDKGLKHEIGQEPYGVFMIAKTRKA